MDSKTNIKTNVATNFFWRLFESCGSQGLTVLVSIVLARMIAPAAYGTLAIVSAFTVILTTFIDSGMGTALVQKKDADDLDFSTLFFFNIVVCVLSYSLLFIAAPMVAGWFEDDTITSYLRVLGLTVLISGVKNIQMSYVTKHLLYKKHFYVTLGAKIVSAGLGIVMAYLGFGIWTLIAQQLSIAFLETVIIWAIVPWRPKAMFAFDRLSALFSYGWKLLVAGLIDTGYNSIRSSVIGKKYSPDDLAYNDRGNSLPGTISGVINSSITSVFFPTVSKIQDNRKLVKDMVRRSIMLGTYIMTPMLVGLAVCAEPLVSLLLTDKWLPCVFFMRIVCITSIFPPVHSANIATVQGLGRSDLILKLGILKKIIAFAVVLATMWISVEAMALGLLVVLVSDLIINIWPNKKLIDYGFFEQIRDIMPNLLLSLLMAIPVYLIQEIPAPQIIVLCLQIITGVAVYILLSIFFKIESFHYLWNQIVSMLRRKKQAE